MDIRVVLGQPHWRYTYQECWGPQGQIDLIRKILATKPCETEIERRTREEYISIAQALKAAGEDFAVINLSVMADTAGLTNDSLMLQRGLPEPLYMFPRDAWVVMPDLCLFSISFPPKNEVISSCRLLTSLLGEGGRVLGRGKTVIVPELFPDENGVWDESVTRDACEEVEELGFLTVAIPNPDCLTMEANGRTTTTFNDHIDRVAGLLEGKNGELHLIVDPEYRIWDGDQGQLSTSASIESIRRACDKAHVAVHAPSRLSVPYSVGFCQLPCGKVVMTSGDDAVAELVENIIGSENIFPTEIPIEFYPAYVHAGVHCLISELPEFLCPRQQTQGA